MKLTAFIILMTLMQVSAATFGQNFTLKEKNVSIAKVFWEIRKQTGYDVLLETSKLKTSQKINVEFNNVPVKTVLDQIIKGTDLEYSFDDKTIFIKQKEEPFFERIVARFQAVDVRGKIVDEKGQPLGGANVKVKGTNKVATTNAQGEFYLQGVDEGAVLQISFIGYKTQEIKAALNVGEIRMEVGSSDLEEVTVSTGYWTTEKALSLGNISKVTSKEIENQPVSSPLLALQGRVAGVEILPNQGTPGSSVMIRIRGQNSLRVPSGFDASDGNAPLYVIDGVPIDPTPIVTKSSSIVEKGFDPLNTISPSNIESIQILKDADATSIYGSRGANGVILITTKSKRSSNGLQAEAGIYRGIGEIVNRVDLLTTEQYIQMRQEAIKNDGPSAKAQFDNAVLGPILYPDLKVWDQTRYTNWQDILAGKNSNVSNIQLLLSGGNSTTSFSFGGNFFNETLLFSKDFGYKRYNLNASANHESSDGKFKINFNSSYGLNEHEIFDSYTLLTSILTLPPNAPKLYKDDGSLNWEPGPRGSATWQNPLSGFQNIHNSKASSLSISSVLSYRILKFLSIESRLGMSTYDQDERIIFPISALNPTSTQQLLGENRSNSNGRSSWIIEPKLVFRKGFSNHNFNALLGGTIQQIKGDTHFQTGTGYTSDVFLESISAADVITSTQSSSDYRYTAVYARIGYDYKNKYLANLTARRDGSSRFGPGRRFGTFGSLSAGWVFTEEKIFKKDHSIISFGKIRASYGTTGNDQIGDYKYLQTYELANNTYHGQLALVPSALFNPDYAWESTKKFETGIELGFFKDRINLEASWYRNRTSNQLVAYTLPQITGFRSVTANLDATLENTGVEFAISGKIVNGNKFKWISSCNISFPKNKLLSYDNIEESPYATIYSVGKPLTAVHGYVWNGVDPVTGLHKFSDLNGDGELNTEDMAFNKALETKYYGGINNTFVYNGIELSFLLQFSNRFANTAFSNTPGTRSNIPITYLDRWQKSNDMTDIQRFTTTGNGTSSYSNYLLSDGVINNVHFLRLKTISLSYLVSNNVLSRIGLSSLKLFLQGHNLYTTSNFSGWDPETLYATPPTRTLSIGIQVKL